METKEFDFYITRKDFGKILRKQRKYYVIGQLTIILLLIIDGILFGLSLTNEINWIYVYLIPCLAIIEGLIFFFGITNGGVQIFEQCHMIYLGNNTIELSCRRKSFNSFKNEIYFKKTMVVSKIKESNDYWIVFDDKRQWAIIPKEITIKNFINE